MFSFFKKPKKKHLTKNSTFYHRENIIQNLADLKNVLTSSAKFTTSHPLTFQGLPLESIDYRSLEERMGEESYILDHEDVIADHQVYFYRKNVEKYKLLIQVHYINDVLCFISTKFSADNLLTVSEKEKIISQLLHNYPDIKLEKNVFDFKFSDAKGNKISATDNVFFYVNYCPMNKSIEKLRADILGGKYIDTAIAEEKDTLDKFI